MKAPDTPPAVASLLYSHGNWFAAPIAIVTVCLGARMMRVVTGLGAVLEYGAMVGNLALVALVAERAARGESADVA